MSLFEPEHMSIEEIIEKLEEAVNLGDSPHRGPFGTHIRKEYLVEAIDKLCTHPETQSNEPLTLEPKAIGQLKQIAQIFNCDPSDQSQLKTICDKLQIWQQAEKEGRLVVLPCKLTDTVYIVESVMKGKKHIGEKVVSTQIDHVTIVEAGTPVFELESETGYWYCSMEAGSDFYLTRQEAEEALGKEANNA